MNSNEMTVHGSTSPSNQLSSVPQISDSHGDGNDHLNTASLSTSTPSTCNITIDGGAISNDNDKQEHQEHSQFEIHQQQQQEVSSNNNIAFNNPDDALEPIERLEKYTSSEIIFHRQIVARSILETLQEVYEQENEVQRVIGVISRLASDLEPCIRVELVEQIPHISNFLVNHVKCPPDIVPQSILPILEQFLTDGNNQVRKITQSAIVIMLEQGLIKTSFLEEQICPLLFQLTDFSNLDDYRNEAVVMMSKIVRFLGKESTEKLLLQPFTRLCNDVSFHVRRVCAANFGEFCNVVGQELSESVLLPQFRNLCDDSIWGVRKSCADVFVTVALIVSMDVRRNILAPLFVNLLNDQSRWVKTAAFQSLGPFISTFADSSKTGLYFTDGGIVVFEDHQSNDSGCGDSGCAENESLTISPTTEPDVDVDQDEEIEDDANKCYLQHEEFNNISVSNVSPQIDCSNHLLNVKSSQVQLEESANEFNSFYYWRDPILDIEFDINLQNENAIIQTCAKIDADQQNVDPNNQSVKLTQSSTNLVSREEKSSNQTNINLSSEEKLQEPILKLPELEINAASNQLAGDNLQSEPKLLTSSSTNCSESSSIFIRNDETKTTKIVNLFGNDEDNWHRTFQGVTRKIQEIDWFHITNEFGDMNTAMHQPINASYHFKKPQFSQDIIPNDLLEHYLSMTNPIHYQNVDPELTHHCAYSLPAVALTLGRLNWPCLKETYDLLAAEMQWKVRWTLASSLHQMSLILGSEYTTKDLLPIFLNFMKDLDEVRFGILQNLAAFLKLLQRPQQLGILPRISDFLNIDNNRNWRFRYTLGEQLIQLATVYFPLEIKQYLLPIGMVLLIDKIAEVRSIAINVISSFFKQLFFVPNDIEMEEKLRLIYDLITKLANSSKWVERQEYVLLCERLVMDCSIPFDVFTKEMLDYMLDASHDKVANVRLAVARSITRTFWSIAHFRSHLRLQQALDDLKDDKDNDVRNFALAISELSDDGNLYD